MIPGDINLKLSVDVTRHLKTISLFSEYLFRYKQEILTKTFNMQELNAAFPTKEIDNSFDFIVSKLNSSKITNCYRNDIKKVIFTFYDMFNNAVIFQNCLLTVFFETIIKD